MKNLKKVLALVLVFAMSLTAVAFAGATYPDVADDAIQADAVKVLKDLGIMVGDENGNFNPDKVVTRAEMAVILCNITGAGEQTPVDSGFADATSAHWASGCIAYAKNAGWISGYSATQFGPDDTIKWEQAVKLIMATLKYEAFADKNGGYPTGWVMAGAEAGVTTAKGAAGAVGEDCTRAKIAMLVYNALDADMMKQTSYGSDDKTEVVKGENLLGKYLDIYKVEGMITDSYKTDDTLDEGEVVFQITKRPTEQAEDELDLTWNSDNKDYDENPLTIDATGTNAADLLSYSSIAYIKVDDDGDTSVASIVPKQKNKSTAIADIDNVYNEADDSDVKDSKKPGYKDDYYQFSYWAEDRDTDSAITTAKVELGATIFVNNSSWGKVKANGGKTSAEILALFNNGIGSAELIDNDNDGKIEWINVKTYNIAIVDSVNVARSKINFKDKTGDLKSNISLDKDDVSTLKEYTITFEGKAIKLEDLQEYDVLTISTNSATSPLYYDIVVTRKKVEGKITGTNSKKKVFFADGEYEYNDDLVSASDVEIGTEGTFYLDSTGKIAYVDERTVASDKYAVLDKFVVDNMDNVTAKMFTYEGKTVTVDVAEKIKINDVKVKAISVAEAADLTEMGLPTSLAGKTYVEIITSIIKGNTSLAGIPAELQAFVTYDMSGDLLSAVTFASTASGADLRYMGKADDVEWQASGSKFKGSKTLGANVKVFNLGEDGDIDDYVLGTPSSLVDEHNYTPYFFTTETGSTVGAVVLLEDLANVNENSSIAFFKSYRDGVYGTDEKDCYMVSYWVDGALAKEPLIIDQTDASISKHKLNLFKPGDAFMFATKGDTVDDMYKVFGIENSFYDGSVALNTLAGDFGDLTGDFKEFSYYNDANAKDNEVFFGILIKAADGSIKVIKANDASYVTAESYNGANGYRLSADGFETINVPATAKVYQYTKSTNENNSIKPVESILDLNVSNLTKVRNSDDLFLETSTTTTTDDVKDLSFVFFRMNNSTVTEVVGIDYFRK